jgi:two-component system, NtrC family, nitrogen regulation sensor histidine kinase NtrY
VIITRKSNFMLEAITLFAYLFCASLFLVALFQLASLIIRSGFQWSLLRDLWQLSIRNQIYGTIIFISIFSFLVIGAATIIFFIQRYNKNNKDRLSRTIQVMSDELRDKLSNDLQKNSFISLYDSSRVEVIQEAITEISEIHNADINLYDVDGMLQVSSQPFVYNKGILSRLMDPMAYYHMKRLRKSQYVQNEKYGQLKYLSIYTPFNSKDPELRAYINIPYFASTMELKQEISNFLVAIINLNAFIFLMAGVIAVFITNRITQSFTWIGKKMQEVNLGKHNQEITWDRKDEIGGLVKEYNKMVQKLDESAVALAKTEREGAWREMARQVAHEIKNPLTPMKLSIQYLQKAIDNNAPNVKELSSSVAHTLIEQIEHLSKIAAEFSQFANIGNTRNENVDLHELLQSLVSLHSMHEHIQIKWMPLNQAVYIFADRTQINRLFTNLLQNAIEAIPEDREGLITITEMFTDGHIQISIRDNGSGIPIEMQSKIYTPNFTTKTSGTGLGLAMSKGIVEQALGDLWFETAEGIGTTFYISFPLAILESS